jgi:glycosyltransferase involved in cell wall biosynthesis
VARAVHRPYRSIGRVLFQRADHVVCTTVAEAKMIASDFPNARPKISVIPNGIDVDIINRSASHQQVGPTVLYAGRLETYKNVQLVLEALPFLDVAMKLVVVGEGSASKELVRRAAQLGVSSRVEFVGAVPWPEVYQWFRGADVFVTMSSRESFGMSVLEAHVAGAQLVASDIPAHREVVGAIGPHISLVPLTSTPAQLAFAIRSAAASPRPAVCKVPSWDDHVESLLRLYPTDGGVQATESNPIPQNCGVRGV